MRIGVLTGGGDVPGLNPCIKAIVNRAEENGWEAYGFRRGWAGPLNVNPDDDRDRDRWVQRLTRQSVRTIDRSGGTVLHTSRTNPRKARRKDVEPFLEAKYDFGEAESVDCTDHVRQVMDHLGIDTLIPIGGEDTLSYAAHLSSTGFPVVSVPKTMDNDVYGTEHCIGFSTAISRCIEFIHALRTPAGSHERIAVIELFGRNSGETALISGYLADADRVLIAEVAFDVERLAELLLEDRQRNPSGYAVVVISEGARMKGHDVVETGEADAYGHRKLGGIGEMTANRIKAITGVDIISQRLAYLMRAGAPDSLDRMVAVSFGALAVQHVARGDHGVMMALRDGKYTTVPIDTCTRGEKRVDVSGFYDTETYRPRIANMLGQPMFLY
ncbi:MAG: 6-phosphofructokinase [Alphaproteobacteria bacterium]